MRHDTIRLSLLCTALTAVLVVGQARDGLAIEGGQGHYPLGLVGWQAGVAPPETGTYFKNYMRFYDGIANAEVNTEVNRVSLAGHSFQHEIAYAVANGVFDSVDFSRRFRGDGGLRSPPPPCRARPAPHRCAGPDPWPGAG